MELLLRSVQVLKQKAEKLGYEGKEVAEYLKQQQALDREDRAAWRNIQMAEIQAQEEKRGDEIHMAELQAEERKRADEIKIQMVKIEADKELTLKELKDLKAQD